MPQMPPAPQQQNDGQQNGNQPQGEQSLRGSFVAILTPLFAVFAGWLAGVVANVVPGVTLDQNQVIAFMAAASTSAIAAGYKWLQGWQQHEQRVSDGTAAPVKSA
jgi:hypothetical protein